jgi:hypothetical protein
VHSSKKIKLTFFGYDQDEKPEETAPPQIIENKLQNND